MAMAMAALRHATRRLACQRPPAIHRAAVAEPPRRLLHRGSSAVGRNFSLAEEQRWMLPRLVHGGSPAVGRTYSRQFSSFHSEPNPSTFMEKAKEVYKLYDRTTELIQRILFILFKLALTGAVVVDCCRSQYLLLIARVMRWAWNLKNGFSEAAKGVSVTHAVAPWMMECATSRRQNKLALAESRPGIWIFENLSSKKFQKIRK